MQKKKQQKIKIKITTFLLMSIFTFLFFGINRSFASSYANYVYDNSSHTITITLPTASNGFRFEYTCITFDTVLNKCIGYVGGNGGVSYPATSTRIYTMNNTETLNVDYYMFFGNLSSSGSFPDNEYSSIEYYIKYKRVGNYVYIFNDNYIGTTTTSIISLTPEDQAIFPSASSSAMTFELEYYISPDQFDFWNNYNVNVYLHNIDQNVLLASSLSPSDIVLLNEDISTAGYGSFSTTTVVLAEGNYRIVAKLRENIFNITTIDEESHQFIVGSSTFIGNISQNTYTAINGYYASSSATSTDSLASACGFFSDSSSVKNCLAFLFVPDGALVYNSLSSFKDQASTHFPLGYVTDFITIISSSATSSLPILDITIPEGIAGAGANITLDVASIGWIFNATSSIGTEAQKGKTIYEIVNPYWEIVCYFAFGFYVLRRILGSQIISKFY